MDTKIDVYEVVKKLVGDIEPVGSEHTDKPSFENLKVMVKLMDDIHTDLDMIAYENKDAYQDSIKKTVDYINKFFDRIGFKEE